jgi:hypothetical protein
MTEGLTVTKQVHFRQGRGTRKVLKEGMAKTHEPLGRVPRLSRLMALAIHMQELVDSGEVTDYADLAQLAHVSRPRITQIMNLLNLAPDVQEEILFLPRTDGGRAPIRERMIRPIAAIIDWHKQRRLWRQLRQEVPSLAQAAVGSCDRL